MIKECLSCGLPIPESKGKKARGLRKFCSDACQIKQSKTRLDDPYYGIPFKCDKKKAVQSRIMLYCEKTFAVIGYLKPICKLRE